MIRHWKLSNFKAAREASLEFAPLTIFTGINSAGKSTIIQSILMTAQTIQDPFTKYPVILNGPLVRLGEFRDVFSRRVRHREASNFGQDDEQTDTHSDSIPDAITIGFQLTTSAYSPRKLGELLEWEGYGGEYDLAAVECSYSFSVPSPEENDMVVRLYPALNEAVIDILLTRRGDWVASDWMEAEKHLRRESNPINERSDGFFVREDHLARVVPANVENVLADLPADFPKNRLGADEQAALTYVLFPFPFDGRRDYTADGKSSGFWGGDVIRFGTILAHFLPKGVYRLWDEAAEEDAFFLHYPSVPKPKANIYGIINSSEEVVGSAWFSKFFSTPDVCFLTLDILDEMVRDIASGQLRVQSKDISICQTIKGEAIVPPSKDVKARITTIAEMVEHLRREFNLNNLVDLLELMQRLKADGWFHQKWSDRRAALGEAIRRNRLPDYRWAKQSLEYEFPSDDSDMQTKSVNFIENFFTSKIRHLGPLRDEPRPLYPMSEGRAPQDVGPRGQYTAFVYNLHSKETVNYIPSIELMDPHGQAMPSDTTLSLAVDDWLNYLGIGDGLNAEDRGRFGFELQVAPDDDGSFFDLTQVGVGVSQVLPILVMCLLAPPGTTLIVEQPELHLHPRVQTRLADFFASMIWLGKQCIIETHSEHLINRVRYRIAIAEEETLTNDVLLYFADMEDGQAEYLPIRINKYGVIPDWPAGFFDESHALAADILRAGTAKRRREKERKDD